MGGDLIVAWCVYVYMLDMAVDSKIWNMGLLECSFGILVGRPNTGGLVQGSLRIVTM